MKLSTCAFFKDIQVKFRIIVFMQYVNEVVSLFLKHLFDIFVVIEAPPAKLAFQVTERMEISRDKPRL